MPDTLDIIFPLLKEKEEASGKLTGSGAREWDGFVLCTLGFVGWFQSKSSALPITQSSAIAIDQSGLILEMSE